jgi:hypothetical protein
MTMIIIASQFGQLGLWALSSRVPHIRSHWRPLEAINTRRFVRAALFYVSRETFLRHVHPRFGGTPVTSVCSAFYTYCTWCG